LAKRSRKPAGRKPEPGKPPEPQATGGPDQVGWGGLRPWVRYAFVLAAVVVWLAGVALRGGIVHPETVYDADPAFHDRMVRHLLDTGHYQEADPLFVQSPPRSPARDMYPTFYHYAAAGFAWLTVHLAGLPVADALMLFGALVGSLVVPLTGWAIWHRAGRPVETLGGMLLAAASTQAIIRGSYAILRPEPLGAALAVAAGLLFWTWREGMSNRWRGFLIVALAGTHFLGAGTWRPFPLLAAIGATAVFAAAFVQARPPRLIVPLLAASGGLAAAALSFDFYRAGGLDHLAFLLPVPLLLIIQWLMTGRQFAAWSGRLSPGKRWGLLAGLTAAGLLVAHAVIPFLRVRVESWLKPGVTPLTTATLYGRLVAELRPVNWGEIFQIPYYFYLPAVLAGLALVWIFRPAARPRDPFLPLATAAFGILGALAIRFEYLTLPFFLALLLTSIRPALDGLVPARWRRAATLAVLVTVCLPVAAIQSLFDLNNLAPPSRREFSRRDCYEWMRQNLPHGTVVAAGWDKGFELQRYAGCATLTDGFLESAVNRERGLEFFGALFSDDEDRLASYCRTFGVRCLLLDRIGFLPMAQTLQLPWEKWVHVTAGENENLRVDVLPAGRRLVYVLLLSGYPTRYFQPIHVDGNYLVLVFQDPPSGPNERR
jgi:hypothetical protein